ncbi:FtsK/SpoIIIE domain-containing protein [Amycolatopsis sp.]|uniref:FtsK/SpoIIIE domain-containing protein n=1 Tax=Amycolatopsis sp. TaxID=37632 RepID=UPI002C5D450F|nr:FtsK/SpoIIIE domain-containing protein [Amycolatopsis sp.]HVV11812.1 FtsK/SpoIIIE domain-containing protein [Amycolatopsis sp.]
MNAHTFGVLFLGGVGLAVVVWVLHKLGRALASIAEALAAAAVVFLALWWLLKGLGWVVKEIVTHPRTTLTVLVLAAWWHWVGWQSLAIAAATVTVVLLSWRRFHLVSFDQWAGRVLRSWWQRWMVYAPKLPGWLHACGLSVKDDTIPVDLTVSLVGRKKITRNREHQSVRIPRVRGVKSGPSWDEVRVELVPGQKPEDFDEAARALASARKVQRCQVREIAPNVVSIDFQRRDLLAAPVPVPALGTAVDVRRVWAGRTEYGQDWHLPLYGSGSHTLTAGASGAGKNSVMWCPLASIAPAIRDGLVRVSGIDPKGMELAYGRGIFHRYAVTAKDALAVLDDLVAAMDARKAEFAGRVRTVPVSQEHPLELLEFDEIGALTRYVDRKTRDAIVERVALLTTQGRALGFTVRGYVQEPTKETVPVRELFPRRICLRVTAKSHVGMVLGDRAYERGAWANRIEESAAGVGYVWGEGLREPLRVRAGWVPDEMVKTLETFVTSRDAVTLGGMAA